MRSLIRLGERWHTPVQMYYSFKSGRDEMSHLLD
ncbi:hypothetical protein GGP81_003320 [Salinibacter ruber]|nr:hypothetical protein [Salinibacter ruber]